MGPETHKKQVELVRPRLEKRDTNFRRAIPIGKRVGVAAWRLATGNSYRTIGQSFGIGESTAMKMRRIRRRKT